MAAIIDHGVAEVLHIDDNRGDLDLTRAAFQDCCPELRYRGIEDPREAMAYLAERAASGAPPPSLVVLDLNMPRVHGQEVLAFIRRHAALRHLPVVVLTTSTRPGEVDECRRLGASAIFTKPASFDGLVEIVADIARRLG